jgi:hypothetical protein
MGSRRVRCGIALAIYLLGWPVAAVAQSVAGTGTYQYTFTANPDSDRPGITPNHALDVVYVVAFNAAQVPSFSLSTINSTSLWTSHALTTHLKYQNIDVLLNDAFDPTKPTITIPNNGGVVEFFQPMSEFFCIDFNPGAAFVDNNNLPYDPFVYGQLDVYDNQQSFQDFYKLWVNGDTSRLSLYAVPEPGTAAILITASSGWMLMRRGRVRTVPTVRRNGGATSADRHGT